MHVAIWQKELFSISQQQITVWIGVLHYVMVFLSFTSTFIYGIENDTWHPMALRADRETHSQHIVKDTQNSRQDRESRLHVLGYQLQNQFFCHWSCCCMMLHLCKMVTIPLFFKQYWKYPSPTTTQYNTTIRLTQFWIKWWLNGLVREGLAEWKISLYTPRITHAAFSGDKKASWKEIRYFDIYKWKHGIGWQQRLPARCMGYRWGWEIPYANVGWAIEWCYHSHISIYELNWIELEAMCMVWIDTMIGWFKTV